MEGFKILDYLYTLSLSPIYINIIGAFLVALSITLISIPKIIRVSHRKQLMDQPGERSSHTQKVPTLGGVAIYFALVISFSIFSSEINYNYSFFMSSITILFFIGLMDDLLVVAPDKKIYAQLISSLLIVFGSGIQITTLGGLFGIHQLPYVLSVIFTVFVFLILNNSYNLIDGLDGLASFIGIIICFAFIVVFFRLFDYSAGTLAVSLLASLLGFIRYNLSNRYKIFMGDTGSMVVGFVLTFLLIRFLFISSQPNYSLNSAPVIGLYIFVIPIVDTVSVIIARLRKGKNPMKPDKNHLHHQLIFLGLNHVTTGLVLGSINIIFIIIAFVLRRSDINFLFLLFLILSTSFVVLIYHLVNRKQQKLNLYEK
ncbi:MULTISPECIES: glycosyltransferase family 4 protein [Weeksella]|uniref:glycosyltransferase family 4 protein n=1 Tax=Weeksella TaxID=1013 RepID=UPI0008A4DFA6|nr:MULTISPECIES: MraY family glycosyltransferase [Weeksella]MDK7374456.1 MraY family glycosyltransferase [Weeksella virosa]MDK7675595.1 MraY family glycosyltransferase [Weeksella virosa]OFM81844.1 undecaprenyl-phosphate alpha-N-acetylglucosaminyl 1-phosphate transferase [Weeksella sp. HMSC059D05]